MKYLYKRLFLFVLIPCLLLFTSCSSPTQRNDTQVDQTSSKGDVENMTSKENITTEKDINPSRDEKKEAIVSEQVLLDKDGIKITLKGFEPKGLFGPSLKVLVENNTDGTIIVQTRDSAVNRVMVQTIFSCEVAGGKKANDQIIIMNSDLEQAGIEVIKDIELKFHIFDSQTWDTIFDSEAIMITTSADPSYVQEYDDSGFLALDKNGIKSVVKKLNVEDSIWGADVFVYVENNRDEDVTVQVREVSVNGFMVDAIFSCDVLAGKTAYDKITFLESQLEENEITSIDEIELIFHTFNTKTWDAIFDSDVITIKFDS